MHTTNIFIVHSIFQDLIAQHMTKSIPHLIESENYLFYNMISYRNEDELSMWRKVIKVEPVGGTVLGDKRKYQNALKKVLELIDEKKPCRVFLSDLNWPLNNGIYGNLIKKQLNQVELCNFPDGIANLYVVNINNKQKIKNYIKSILGFLGITIPYFNYKSDHVGLGLFNTIYSLLPPAISQSISQKIIKIPPLKPSSFNVMSNSCIFLGQPYEIHMPIQKYRNLCLDAINYTKALGYTNLYYKPHPREDLNLGWKIFKRNGFSLLNETGSVEELFLVKQAQCIVSYNSSALVNLKLMFGDSIRCISFGGTDLYRYTGQKKELADKLKDIYAFLGVEYY